MKKRTKRLAGMLLTVVMSMGMVCNANALTMEEAEQKADELEEQKEAAEAENASLSQQLENIIADMNETQNQLTAKEDEIEAAENELVQAQVAADNQYESMKIRIKFMYEGGNTQLMEMLMTSESMGEFLNKAEYISSISEYDRNELIKYQDTVKEIEEKEASLQAEYAELQTLQDQLITQQNEVQTMLDSNEAQLEDIQSQISENEAVLEDLRAKAEEAKRIQEEQAAAAASGGGSYTESSGGNVVSGNGYFTHPCPGYTYQSSYFGEIRPYEVGGHKGHDYAAPTGTPTYAAAAGTVIIAGYSPSAGNWVVINHGNGLTTKYMHHSAICVTAGQTVEKGQQIGYVGSTGQSTGPHLHFQVEENGVAVNPDKYL
ncbi:peptidoglycan DD-metalloendopeptidase family protein [Ruminococcus sp. CLA-AA-H200]|uniref:Peptidoglycan DD-metalloendopeptidase family protein n=1 Tax=Ruminococcus turbiniformis TaxID=2881258 RepID=A0ABS8FYJ1_9FIRM|nr:M23 family metallopeptidase [Ruminococcus turbiniformis]MCC2255138.1 peptidoglycan DD-metalloendopeptidase family protein [Ruminococcus turbiniformis]